MTSIAPFYSMVLTKYAELKEWDAIQQLLDKLPPDYVLFENAVRHEANGLRLE